MSGAIAGITLLVASIFMQKVGIISNGVGILIGNVIITVPLIIKYSHDGFFNYK